MTELSKLNKSIQTFEWKGETYEVPALPICKFPELEALWKKDAVIDGKRKIEEWGEHDKRVNVYKLKQRYNKLTQSSVRVQLTAGSEAEYKEREDRAIDVVRAMRSAIEEGRNHCRPDGNCPHQQRSVSRVGVLFGPHHQAIRTSPHQSSGNRQDS